ncbi:hypothetical protein EG68_12315 [Paragonimus skrjabini miyazakii]|uniref:Uncharacterized protein n=1 Tax=Paragonimus skrjabini miyazakii TaxID=59628 RepID=A0A8S9YBU2_9TREM|nr:hypothetical protein EG68_12315 [Paragonimus skrjabini miyazakii]
MFIPRKKTTTREFETGGFDDASVRNDFIRKVYLILFAQLTLTGGFITLCMLMPFVCLWIKQHPLFVYLSYGVFFAIYFTLVCCQNVRRTFPGNYLALLLFTLAFSYLSGAITCSYNTISVLITVVITAATCLFVSFFALSTCVDFTRCTALFMVLSIALALFGISCMVVYLVLGYNKVGAHDPNLLVRFCLSSSVIHCWWFTLNLIFVRLRLSDLNL